MSSRGADHKWQFKARFRRNAFGWRSQPAIQRIREAVSEIKKVARKDRLLAAEGAVVFLEKVSPALERVDSSSGAIGVAVNRAIANLVPITAGAPADEETRGLWLERLYVAYDADDMPYIEALGDFWGELCASKDIASRWADMLIKTARMAWSPDNERLRFFKGTTNCLSALLRAERLQEILDLLELESLGLWHYREYGVKALAAMGRKAEAIRYAEERRGSYDNPISVASACEDVLLSSGFVDEAYRRYGLQANHASTYLAWFRAVVKKYPHKEPEEILDDLVNETPGDEGKWFAAAKHAGLYDKAIALANRSPCSPQTLTRAARDFAEKNPAFAVESGIAALHWIAGGYGYEITSGNALDAHAQTMKAAHNDGCEDEAERRIRDLVTKEPGAGDFVMQALRRRLGLS